MRWFRFLLVAILAVLVQTTLMRLLASRDAYPDLVVAVLVVFCLGVSPSSAFLAGAVLGFGRDLFSIEPFGLSTAAFAVLGWLVARKRPSVSAEHFLMQALYAFLCAVAVSGVSVLALALQGAPPAVGLVVRRTALSALATAGVAAVVGWLVWRHARAFGLRRRSEFGDA